MSLNPRYYPLGGIITKKKANPPPTKRGKCVHVPKNTKSMYCQCGQRTINKEGNNV